ncbi:histidinol-phosphate aminotransferase [Gonapodya prolifera JEL478]|uniref:histidinol-phosphate transaminase n=1 Tax=Gonapodya prolifera (strain JEL478) TaxID=1344416 RepID=A0A139B0H5_GONPJ|nr:histidinol-phosphate aminotransferase [Gonapodya prolifera JEL478]|eukprot:KXS22496.1 histidinol-phosphate aminotransferase [Gonapodya prolifera JEL478]
MGRKVNLQSLVRPNIWSLEPYRAARDDYSEGILLDANENSLGSAIQFSNQAIPTRSNGDATKEAPSKVDGDGFFVSTEGTAHPTDPDVHPNRYPDPHQTSLKQMIADYRKLPSPGPDHLFLGVGSDECIDILMRVFCAPGKDSILITPPTYGMYRTSAEINDVKLVKVPLIVPGPGVPREDIYQLDVPNIKAALRADPTIKLLILCSPGNPTATALRLSDIRELLHFEGWNGIVVVDEAYVDFVEGEGVGSVATWVAEYGNLVVSQTMSKAFGMAGVRLGLVVTDPSIAAILNKTKAPYNISSPTSILGRRAMSAEGIARTQSQIATLTANRTHLLGLLSALPALLPPYSDSHANFVLVPVLTGPGGKPSSPRAKYIYKKLAEQMGVVIRYRGGEYGCEGCLRITVGDRTENEQVVKQLAVVLSEDWKE